MNTDTFGQRLKRLRLARGLSQRKLATAVGLTNGAISQAESEGLWVGQLPSYEIVERLAAALGVSMAVLVGDARVVIPPPRLTEQQLFDRFGIRPYEQPNSSEGVAMSAGTGAGVPQGIDDATPRRVPGRRYLWEAPVVGDCMMDEIQPGEVVIYNTRLGPEIDRIMVALRNEEELLIKRLRLVDGVQLLRPNHGEDVPVDEQIRFLGRAVSAQRALF